VLISETAEVFLLLFFLDVQRSSHYYRFYILMVLDIVCNATIAWLVLESRTIVRFKWHFII